MKKKAKPASLTKAFDPEVLRKLREEVAQYEEYECMIGSRLKMWPSDVPREWQPRADDEPVSKPLKTITKPKKPTKRVPARQG